MALRQSKRISELSALSSASLNTTIVGVDNGTTYKIELDVLADSVSDRINVGDRNRLDNLEIYTASFSSSLNISQLNSYTASQNALNTAFTNGINARLYTSSFNDFSASVNTRILAATNEQSFTGLISGSSQLTASLDTRYAASGSSATVNTASLVTRLNTIESVTSSYETKGRGLVSGSSQLTSSFDLRYLVTGSLTSSISQLNTFSASQEAKDITLLSLTASLLVSQTNLNAETASLESRFTTLQSLTASYSSSIGQINVATSSYETKGRGIISGSSQLTSSFDTRYATSGSGGLISSGTISGSSQLINLGFPTTSSQDTLTNKTLSNPLIGSLSITSDGLSRVGTYGNNVEFFSKDGFLLNPATDRAVYIDVYDNNNKVVITSDLTSYETRGRGIVSGSSQLTSSFDNRYETDGRGIVSGSTQLTSSFELKGSGIYSSSAQLPSGLISGSSQLTSSFDLRYLVTGSVTSSINQLNTFTSSHNIWSSSVATTGSNSFNGNQTITGSVIQSGSLTSYGVNTFIGNTTITGSLTVSSVAVVNGAVTVPTGSIISLTTGSSIFVDSSGAITGSLTGSVFGVGDVALFSSSVDGRIKGLVTTSSLNSYTASISTASLATTASLNLFTSSINLWTGSVTTTASFNSFTSSHNIWTSSVATTGSNSFNGSQTITGSLLVSGSTTFTGSISISSGSITMPNRPGFRVTGAGGAKVAVTPLTGSYLNVDWQQSNAWDNSTGTFTAPIAGLYQVNVVVRTNSNSLGTISQLIVYKNYTGVGTGTAQIMVEFGSNTTMNHTGGSTICKLAAGETLRMVVAVGEISFDQNDNFSVAYIG